MRLIERIPARHRTKAAALAVLVAGIVLWRVVSAILGGGHEIVDTAVPVVAAQAIAGDVPLYLEGIGTIRAYNTVTVRPRVDGQLMEVTFQEGQNVKRGDVLAKIDPRPLQAILDNTQGTLARDQSSLANAKHDLERFEDLAKSGYATHQQVDTQTAAVNSLAAAVRADEGSVRNAEVQLGYTTITAPIDGRTGIRQIDAGNIVHAADANGLVVITQVQPIAAIFTLPQSDIAQVVGTQDPASMTATALDSDGTKELDQGVLELVDNTIDQSTGTVRLKARFPNARQTLWPGEFVNIRLQVGMAHNAVTIPSQAVERGPQGTYVYVIKPDDTAEMRPLRTGQDRGGKILITNGLNASERVVTDGQLRLTSGTKVRVTNEDAPSQSKITQNGEEKTAALPPGSLPLGSAPK